MFEEAFWFKSAQMDNDLLDNRYVSDSWLPGDVAVGVIRSWCCMFQLAFFDKDLFIPYRTKRVVVRGERPWFNGRF